MVDKEQLDLLKRNVNKWNEWRTKYPNDAIYLSGADLRGARLGPDKPIMGSLGSMPRGADLSNANLSEANLSRANLDRANLSGANLNGANLKSADLSRTEFRKANLSEAILRSVDLSYADLNSADLSRADLSLANLSGTSINNALFSFTILGNIDLSSCRGLKTTRHGGPSTIGIDTILKSKGNIPIEFLKGCGLSDWEIKATEIYNPSLNNKNINDLVYEIYDLRAQKPLQISPLFISYSHKDCHFVEKLEKQLTESGIRYWRDVHHATSGPLEKVVDQAIRHNPTVLIIFSKNSIQSDWVQHEVESAREFAKETGRDVLCPIALDGSWKNSNWPRRLMRQVMEYSILDFSAWKDDVFFKKNFKKLIDGLELYYSK
jgi:hypothetical protein